MKTDEQDIADSIKLPSDETLIATAKAMLERFNSAQHDGTKYASVQHLLCLICVGQPVDASTLPQYNPYYIKRTLKRLKAQKLAEIVDKAYVLTTRGKRWILKYTLEDLSITVPAKWDGKWRMIIYDVARHKATLRNIFRSTIKRLGFYNVQESVWIFPYPCEKEISFLRDYCGMGSDVMYIIVHKIENDSRYKEFFKLQ